MWECPKLGVNMLHAELMCMHQQHASAQACRYPAQACRHQRTLFCDLFALATGYQGTVPGYQGIIQILEQDVLWIVFLELWDVIS